MHTPGPWTAEKPLGGYQPESLLIFAHGEVIGRVNALEADGRGSVVEDNARLVAAAPQLLAALELILSAYPGAISWHDSAFLAAAQNAVSKARGDAPAKKRAA